MESGLAHLLLEHSPDPLLLLDPDGSISFLNAAAEELFGYSRAQLLGADSSLLLAEASREPFHGVLAGLGASAPRSGQPFAGSGRRADGTELPVEITCSLLPSDAGAGQAARSVALSVRGAGHRPAAPSGNRPAGLSGTGQSDAGAVAGTAAGFTAPRRTPRRTAVVLLAASTAVPAAFAGHDDQVRAGVLRDPLTSLPNGTLFNERLAAALRRPDPVDVLLLNLDDFKNLNDMLGRSSADELLVEVASRLRNCVRPHDTVARLGGDEFVVLLTECLNADAVAKRIAESLYEPLRVGGSLVRPGVSMGLASRTSQTLDGAELLRQADAAMTAAKTGGKNAWLRFRPEMLNTVAAKADGQAGLRQAVELGQISVHYQPVVSPGLGRGGAVRGVCALGTARPAGPAQPVPARGRAERPDPRDRRRGHAPGLRGNPALAGRRRRVQRRGERLRPAVPEPRLRHRRAGDCGVHRGGSAPAHAGTDRECVLRVGLGRAAPAAPVAGGRRADRDGRLRHRATRPWAGSRNCRWTRSRSTAPLWR